MKQRFSFKTSLSQRLKVSPTLRYSVAGVAFAGLFCLIIFLYGNFGNNKEAIANKLQNLANNGISSNPALSSNPKGNSVNEPNSGILPEVNIDNLTNSSATVKWKTTDGIYAYKLRFRASNTNDWTYITLKNKQKKLNNLLENTYYEYQIETFTNKAMTDSSGWSAVQSFKTQHSCGNPVNLTTEGISSTTAMLRWVTDANVNQYAISYREEGQSEWSDEFQVDGHANRFLLTSLKPGTNYQWQIRCQCRLDESSWSDYTPQTFATEVRKEDANTMSTVSQDVKISPNPTAGQFTVELNLQNNKASAAHLEIINLAGQVIMKENIPVENNMVYEALSFGSSLPQGFYLVKIEAGSQVFQTQISIAR